MKILKGKLKNFSAYEKNNFKNFEIVTLTLREKDLGKNEYLNLVEKSILFVKDIG